MNELVQRIQTFLKTLQKEENSTVVRHEYRPDHSVRPKDPLERAIEQRLVRLDDQEQAELDRLLRKFLGQS